LSQNSDNWKGRGGHARASFKSSIPSQTVEAGDRHPAVAILLRMQLNQWHQERNVRVMADSATRDGPYSLSLSVWMRGGAGNTSQYAEYLGQSIEGERSEKDGYMWRMAYLRGSEHRD